VIQAVRERKSSLRVIGFDGIRVTRHIGLSSISQGPIEIGTIAAESLLRIMKEEKEFPPIIKKITPYLVDYNS
jgi:DNA-binding LacI/PurR family transcriptional regulator